MLLILLLVAACGAADGADTTASGDTPTAVTDADGSGTDTGASASGDDTAADDDSTTADGAASGEDAEGAAAAPFATVSTVDGGELVGADLAGKDVALWFWAPWCPTCNAEAPGVAEVVDGLDSAVTVVGVAGRDAVPAMEEFVAQHQLQGLTHVADVEGQIWQQYGIVGQPAWVFIDGETGRAERVLGAIPEGDLQSRLDALAS